MSGDVVYAYKVKTEDLPWIWIAESITRALDLSYANHCATMNVHADDEARKVFETIEVEYVKCLGIVGNQ